MNGEAQILTFPRNKHDRHMYDLTPTTTPYDFPYAVSRDHVYDRLRLRLTATVTVAGGAADGVLAAEQPLSLIRNVKLTGSSGVRRSIGLLRDGDFAALFRMNQFLRGEPGEVVGLTIPGLQAATPISATLELPFTLLNTVIPRRTLLNAVSELEGLDLVVSFGTGSDLIIGGDRVVTIGSPNVALSVVEYQDPEFAAARYAVKCQRMIEKPVTASSTRFDIDLKSNFILRGLLIKQFTCPVAPGSGPHTPVETMINELSLELGGNPRYEFKGAAFQGWEVLQAKCKDNFGMSAVPTGYAFMDFAEDAGVDALFDTEQYKSVVLYLNITAVANGYVRAYPVEIIDFNK